MTKKIWAMTQTWNDVLFLHWPIDPAEIRKFIPSELELDLYSNRGWIGIVLFKARGTRPRFFPPIPGSTNFLEVNVRTYVKYKNRRGVYFFSLDADSALAVKIASTGSFLPYRKAQMSASRINGQNLFKSKTVEKAWPEEKIALHYRTTEEKAVSTYLEKWLTERYCLWTKPGQRLMRLDIKHSPWKLKYVKGEITENVMAPYLKGKFANEKAMAHYAKRKKVRFYPPIIET